MLRSTIGFSGNKPRRRALEVSEQTFGLNARTRGCLGGISFVFVSHKGELQPCGYFDVQAGSVREAEFSDLWENAPLFKDLRQLSLLEGKCGKCDYSEILRRLPGPSIRADRQVHVRGAILRVSAACFARESGPEPEYAFTGVNFE